MGENGQWTEALIAPSDSAYIAPAGWNRYTLGRIGKSFLLYVNGALINSVESNKIPCGKVIFGWSSGQAKNVKIQLDEFVVFSAQ